MNTDRKKPKGKAKPLAKAPRGKGAKEKLKRAETHHQGEHVMEEPGQQDVQSPPGGRRHRRRPGERCGTCISWTRGQDPVIDSDPLGICECGPPTATAVPQQGPGGVVDFAAVTKWPVLTRKGWYCQQWEPDDEPQHGSKALPNWSGKRAF